MNFILKHLIHDQLIKVTQNPALRRKLTEKYMRLFLDFFDTEEERDEVIRDTIKIFIETDYGISKLRAVLDSIEYEHKS